MKKKYTIKTVYVPESQFVTVDKFEELCKQRGDNFSRAVIRLIVKSLENSNNT